MEFDVKAYISSAAAVLTLVITAAAVLGQTGGNVAGSVAKAYSEALGYEPRVFPDVYSKKKKKKEDKAGRIIAAVTVAPAAVEPTTVSVPVSVFDGSAKLVPGLTVSDFSVYVDDEEQRIESVEVGGGPLNLVLMIDASPSTEYKLKDIQQYADTILERLRPDDKVMAVSFSMRLKVLADWTSDKAVIRKAIEKFVKKRGEDGTSLFESVTEIFDKNLAAVAGRKAIVIFSDGMDTTSQKASYESSLIAAERGGVPVFPIYFDTMVDMKDRMKTFPGSLLLNFPQGAPIGMPSGRRILTPEAEAEIGRWYLDDLVNLSGGRAIVYERLKAGKSLITMAIPDELHGQYLVTFTPAKGAPAGQRRKIRIRVNRPNMLVTARGSLISG